MNIQLIKEIRDLTIYAIECIDKDMIEQCSVSLNKRQSLLEKLKLNYGQLLLTDDRSKQEFIELMLWIQQQDQPAIEKSQLKRNQKQKMSAVQIKTKKALQFYKNVN